MNRPPGKRSWEIRSFRPGDEPAVSRLFRTVFGRTVAEGYWEWKLRAFSGADENEWIAEADGEIVGHYAVTPVRFKVGDRRAIVPHGCDAMTHPAYRRQGILTALGQRANEVWQRAGAPFQIGFHYGGWGSVREGLGWRALIRLVWVKHWIRPFASAAGKLGIPGAPAWIWADRLFHRFVGLGHHGSGASADDGGIRLERISHADERLDRLWERLSPNYGVLAVRDQAWVRWRYLEMPGALHQVILATYGDEPVGYVALRVVPEAATARATIVDLFVAPGDVVAANALLARAIASAYESGAGSLAALAAPESPVFRRLTQAGFWRARHGYDFSIVPYTSPDPVPPGRDWLVTGAEGDVI